MRVARALEHLPQVSDAFRRGELSYAVVRALTRIATAENETELLQLARHGTASHVERVVRAWRRVDRLDEEWAERERHRSRYLHLYPDDDGMYVLRGRLTPELGALLERALAAATEALYEESNSASPNHEQTSCAQREADAIGLLAEWALGGEPAAPVRHEIALPQPDHQSTQGAAAVSRSDEAQLEEVVGAHAATCDNSAVVHDSANPEATMHDPIGAAALPKPRSRKRPSHVTRAERFQVVVHVDAEALRAGSDSGQAVLAGGVRVSPETSRRIACDCSRVVMVHDSDGNVLDVGRRTRAVPTAIRRALEHRDRGCRFPGCNRRICDAHHIMRLDLDYAIRSLRAI